MVAFAQYAPEFRVQINGADLPPALKSSVTRVSFQSGMEGASRVEVTIANENLRWLDNPLLHMDNGFKLGIRYAPDPFEEVFVGEITGVDAAFPSSGVPTLTVVAHDFLQRLTVGTKDRAFQLSIPCIGQFPLPDPAVVALVAGTNLLIPDLDPVGAALSFLMQLANFAIDPLEAKRAVRVQQKESDFDFLQKVAKDNGWEMYIDQTRDPHGYRLRFQFLIQDYAPSATLTWGQSLLEFTPRISTVGQVWGVAMHIWISSISLELIISLSYDYDRAAFNLQIFPGLGDIGALLGADQNSQLLTLEPTSPALAPKQLISELLPRLNNRLTGKGSAVGNLDIRPGRVINLVGLGDQFGGLWRITSATHTLDQGGFRTDFEVRKEVWFGSIPVPKGPGGLLRVQGQTIH
jgi:uncharacterized protein